jgi:iron(III) transport system substrate-binding protein
MYVAYGGPDIIAEAFQKATGIKINYISMSSGEVITRLQAEKSNPQTDIWFGGGSDAFVQAKSEQLIIPYISPNARFVAPEFKDADGYWEGLSLVTVGLLINTDRLKARGLTLPTTWAELANPQYKGEITASNPNTSGTAYTTVSGILQAMGEEAGWQFLDKLYDNISFLEQTGSGPANKVIQGEYAIGIVPDPHNSPINNPNAPLQSIFPTDGVLAWPSPVAIVSGAKHPANAMIFVDWCLSPEGQKVLMQASPRVPTTDVEPITGVPNLSELNLVPYDVLGWGAVRTKYLGLFNARYPQFQ